jgi:hypothetical protein
MNDIKVSKKSLIKSIYKFGFEDIMTKEYADLTKTIISLTVTILDKKGYINLKHDNNKF